MSFDREACLSAFERYNESTGTAIVSLEELDAKSDADLALFSAGVLAALQASTHTGNGDEDPLSPPLGELLGKLAGIVGIGPSAL